MTIQLLQGDCTEVLPTLPASSVQCVVTSPPYFGLRDYGLPPTGWPEVAYAPMVGLPPVRVPEQECCLGLEDDPIVFIAHLVHVFRLVRRVLRDDGVIWINMGDSYAQPSKWGCRSGNKNRTSEAGRYPRRRVRADAGYKDKDLYGVPWRLALALEADGWYLRQDVIWYKPNALPDSVTDRPSRCHEYFFILSKARYYFYDGAAIREPATGRSPGNKPEHKYGDQSSWTTGLAAIGAKEWRNKRSVWSIPTQQYPDAHYAVFPPALITPCILASTSLNACEHCGAPWERVIVATGHTNEREPAHQPGRKDSTKTDSTGWAPVTAPTNEHMPTCACSGNTGAGRCVVLDPFGGSGTVGRVALRLNRDAVLIELNPAYVEQQERRIDGVQPFIPGLESAA